MAASLAHGATIGGYLLISWLASQIGTTIDVGVALALRTIPAAIVGLPIGYFADRVDRRRLLIGSHLALAGLMWAAGLIGNSDITIGFVFALAVSVGILDATRGVANQSLIYDLVGRESALRGIATTNLGMSLAGIGASLVVGVLLANAAIVPALWLFAGLYLAGAIILLGQRTASRQVGAEADAGTDEGGSVPRLTVYCLANEMLGFSSVVLLPAFALEVFGLGAVALGATYAARNIGGVVALFRLATRRVDATERDLLTSTLIFGLGLIGFALIPIFSVSLAFSAVIGAASSLVDAQMQTLLQTAVGSSRRGTGMGIWYACLGFGPIGNIELAAVAQVMGVQSAQAANGALLALIAGAGLLIAGERVSAVHRTRFPS
jgi:MFS family permease